MYINCVVTLHRKEDLDNFYLDMENGSLLGRNLKPTLTRPLSRNTHYDLTAQEIQILSTDSRVVGVYPTQLSENLKLEWTQNGVWSKTADNLATYDNWGLYRCIRESNVSNWGVDGTGNITDTITVTGTGRNVDIIIDDGMINPSHPELARVSDGTGGTRVIQLDWNTLTSIAQSIDDDAASALTGPYAYGPYLTSDSNHGVHVAGTAGGNTQGWARDANIYNIRYTTTPSSLIKWDYIRAFHKFKAVNATTGLKNPTIVNCSYGSSINFPDATFDFGPVTQVYYRGTMYSSPSGFTDAQLESYKISVSGGVVLLKYFNDALVADIEDAISDGIIVVGSAGNDYNYYMDLPGGQDYDNYFVATFAGVPYAWYYNRGSAPGASPNAICVGAVHNFADDRKADYSNVGPRIDVWAPGSRIQSSLHFSLSIDPRNPSFRLGKFSGTSMASPQVTGILACLLETYPRMTPAQAKEWIINTAKLNKLTSGTGDYDLLNSSNRYLYYEQQRKQEGQITTSDRFGIRKTTGQTYPRPKILRYG